MKYENEIDRALVDLDVAKYCANSALAENDSGIKDFTVRQIIEEIDKAIGRFNHAKGFIEGFKESEEATCDARR